MFSGRGRGKLLALYRGVAGPDGLVLHPYALTPNAVELIPTLGALSPRDGPVQDPVLTAVGGEQVTRNS